MKILVQELDRCGERPIVSGVAFFNDGPLSFKDKEGNLDLAIIKEALFEALVINDEEELNYIVASGAVVSKDGQTVHISMEEVDYTFTNIDYFFHD